jgi:L-alanine-DL-glutamate epimerase-like enolase superfamily enzyme
MSAFRITPAVLSGLAGALFVGSAATILVAFVVGPAAGMTFGFAEAILFGACASVFGVIAGAVAGAEGDEHDAVPEPAVEPITAPLSHPARV